MKLRHLIITALGAACLLASCGKEPNNTTPTEEKPSVTVSPSSLSFSNAAGSQDITLTSNCNWTAESDAAWAGPSITSGGASRSGAVVKISVKDNKGVEARNATITFTGKNDSGTVTAKLTVSQEAYDVPEILELSSTTMTMSAKGESKTFTFKATRDWIAGVYAEEDSWIGCPIMGYGSEKSQSITISALENKGGERTGKVTFKMGSSVFVIWRR